jgi:hypothetical protein
LTRLEYLIYCALYQRNGGLENPSRGKKGAGGKRLAGA